MRMLHSLVTFTVLLVSCPTAASAASLTINPQVQQVEAGAVLTAVVTLNAPAATAQPVVLGSSNAAAAAVPGAIGIAAGAVQGVFPITVKTVAANTAVTITAHSPLIGTVQASFTVLAPPAVTALTFQPSSVSAGQTAVGTVTLSRAAAFPGVRLSLAANNPLVAVPPQMVVPPGAFTGTFTTAPVGATTQVTGVSVMATSGNSSRQFVLALVPPPPPPLEVASITLPSPIVSGAPPTTGQVTLNRASPGNSTIALATNHPSVTITSAIIVLSGHTTGNFNISAANIPAGAPSSTAQVTGTLGNSSRSAATTVEATPVVVSALSVPQTLTSGGAAKTASVFLNVAAPQAATVALASSSPNLQAPASVTIPAGQFAASFDVHATGLSPGVPTVQATLTASLGGSSKSGQATVFSTSPAVGSLSVPSPILSGGPAQTAQVVLAQSSARDETVSLSRALQNLQMPNQLVIPAGQTSGSFQVSASGLPEGGQNMVTSVSAGLGLTSKTVSVTVNAPPPSITIVSFNVAPDPVVGGNPTTGTVTLSVPAPAGGQTVFISIFQQRGYVSAPSTFTIAAGQTAGSFQIDTTPNVVFSDGTSPAAFGPGNIGVHIGAQATVQDFFTVQRPQ
jgi:hypothetical protein